jgi:hypothetical protein
MSENPMNAEQIAKQAMDLAARAEELARHAHETAGVDEQLGQLEAELGALDAEEAGLLASGAAFDAEAVSEDATQDWAEHFAERVGSLGDRIGLLVDQATEAAMRRVDDFDADDDERGVEEHTVEVDGPGRVEIDSDGGSVRVTSHPFNTVTVAASGRGSKDPSRRVELSAGTHGVTITSRSPHRWRGRGVRLDVRVPEGSELVVATRGGSVVVDDVHGPADLRTGGGNLQIRGGRDRAELTAGGGSIDVTDFDGAVTARTGGGRISIDGTLRGANTIRTGGGNITVRLADGTNVRVDARGTGSVTDIDRLHAQGGRIVGDIGDGSGGTLDAKTGGGTIRIIC